MNDAIRLGLFAGAGIFLLGCLIAFLRLRRKNLGRGCEYLRPFLKSVVTVEDAERELRIAEWAPKGLAEWRRFLSRMQPGDRLWFFNDFTAPRAGFGGYAIERGDVILDSITTARY